MSALTKSETETYYQQGYLIPQFRLPDDRVRTLRETLDRLIKENPGIRPEKLVSIHIEGTNAEGIRGSSEFFDLARDPDLLDMVSQLIGADIILWGCQIFCKPPGDGMEVPWHQDGHYWPMRPLATCTVWVALDDSRCENGCLRVIPGSHREQMLFEHLQEDRDDIVLNRTVKPGQFDEGQAVDVELEAGQMSLHDVYMIHGSNPNTSTKRRAGVAIRYMPATSHFRRENGGPNAGYKVDFSTRPIWQLRGVDRCGKNDFDVGHPRS